MGESKRQELQRSATRAALGPLVEPGWRLDVSREKLVSLDTVLSFHERGASILLRCRRHGCYRRLPLDLKSALRFGLGERELRDVVRILHCGYWEGCGLDQAEVTYRSGRPLLDYVQDATAFVTIVCEACGWRLMLAPLEVIKRLKEAKRGSGNTGVLAVGKAIRGACPKCRTFYFRSDVVHVRDDAP